MHIIKTTASIPSKFCTTLKTTKCSSCLSRYAPTSPKWPFWKTVKSRVVTLYLSEFVEPHGQCPDPDEYFSNKRRAWTQLNRHHIAVQRQKQQVEHLQTQPQQCAQIHDTETGTICPHNPLHQRCFILLSCKFAYVIRSECLPPH